MNARARALCLGALVLTGVVAPAGAAAPSEPRPAELWRAFPLEPTTTAEEPARPQFAGLPAAAPTPTQTVVVEGDSGELSPFAIAGIAFAFAMAGTALAIVLWTAIQALAQRSGHRTRETIVAPRPFASAKARVQREAPAAVSPAPVAPAPVPSAPVAPTPTATAPAASSAAPTLVEAQREAPAKVSPAPVAPAPVSPAPVAPTPAAPAPAASSPPPTLVEAPQPSTRLTPRAPAEARTCTIELWRGYIKSRYYATTIDPGGDERTIAASPFFRPERGVPLAESVAAREAYEALLADLAELGWSTTEAGGPFVLAGRNQSA
jgi:hypothetical protein